MGDRHYWALCSLAIRKTLITHVNELECFRSPFHSIILCNHRPSGSAPKSYSLASWPLAQHIVRNRSHALIFILVWEPHGKIPDKKNQRHRTSAIEPRNYSLITCNCAPQHFVRIYMYTKCAPPAAHLLALCLSWCLCQSRFAGAQRRIQIIPILSGNKLLLHLLADWGGAARLLFLSLCVCGWHHFCWAAQLAPASAHTILFMQQI